jgi:hypothetical protein
MTPAPQHPQRGGSSLKAQLKHLLAVTAIVIALPGLALAACDISGTITATPNTDPMGPDWVYTAVISWDTGSQYALSHMGLWLDIAGGTCSCQDFQQAISFDSIIGQSGTTCPVDYAADLNCQGDPSIPGVYGVVLKLEPNEELCEAGTVGQGTFVFYSNLGPAAIDEDALTLVDKFGQNYCFGSLTGDFPSMPCNPVSDANSSWGSVKGMFR